MPAESTSPNKMTGVQRAAVLLLSLGEQNASSVLTHMGAREVQALGLAMASLSNISREQVHEVLESFTQTVEQQTSIGVGADDYIRKVLVTALGEDKASGVIDRISLGRTTKGLDGLKWMESRAIGEIIGQEHPQIIAIVLAYLEPEQAAEVLGYLQPRVRADVIMRIATLDGIQPQALKELEDIIERQFSGGSTKFKSSTVGGLKVAASILNSMETASETEIMEAIVAADANIGQGIQELMFVFEDLLALDDRSMQRLLRDVSSDLLVIALKGTEQALRDKIFANMSKRAADMLKDDLEVKGPVKVSEVDAAQKEILAVARRLSEGGEISLGSGGGGEAYV